MAYRLAEAGRKVTVIETGGTDVGPFINMPAALSYPMSMKRYDWGYKSVIGGSSSINGMIYVRGHAKDFDHWAESGAQGWAYADVLPYYKRMEDWHSGGRGGDKNWRGKGGPLHVTRGPGTNRLTRAFIKAGAQAGYELTPDYNGEKQEGFGPFDATIWKGKRWSAASAYLRPAQATGNCEVIQGTAARVVMENGRATGVELTDGRVIVERQGFIRSKAGLDYPDIQFHFLPIAVRYDGTGAQEGFQAHVGPMRSKSRGEVTLTSADPNADPNIFFNYMSHPDRSVDAQSDEALDAAIREDVESAYHPCGTCKMGSVDDPMAVVDPQGRVIGVEGLRVADSSIFPRITNGNLNAPSIMVGEKIADHVLGKAPLAAQQ
ncbi:Oxygen-dependent choline dehydrogenase [Nymphon striatum]|nr:Oxygen-dependent choline dehydrogenase [Nymphon striatum]